MKKLALMAFLVLGAGLLTSRAEVRFSVNFGTGFCAPVYYHPRPVCVGPPVVVYRQPVCEVPAPVICEEPVVVYRRPQRVIVVDDNCSEGYGERRPYYRHAPLVTYSRGGYYHPQTRVVYSTPYCGW
jgi:hypothetical protein